MTYTTYFLQGVQAPDGVRSDTGIQGPQEMTTQELRELFLATSRGGAVPTQEELQAKLDELGPNILVLQVQAVGDETYHMWIVKYESVTKRPTDAEMPQGSVPGQFSTVPEDYKRKMH